MTALEYVLAAVFAAIGLVPLALAIRWERRLRHETRSLATGRRQVPVIGEVVAE